MRIKKKKKKPLVQSTLRAGSKFAVCGQHTPFSVIFYPFYILCQSRYDAVNLLPLIPRGELNNNGNGNSKLFNLF